MEFRKVAEDDAVTVYSAETKLAGKDTPSGDPVYQYVPFQPRAVTAALFESVVEKVKELDAGAIEQVTVGKHGISVRVAKASAGKGKR
jgi:hypothetical protein